MLTGVQEVLRDVQLVAFVLLAAVALRLWRRRPGPPAAWVAGAFGLMATVVVLGRLLPQEPGQAPRTAVALLIVLIVLFPYPLYRFAAAFAPVSRPLRVVSAGLTALAAGLAPFLPAFPPPGAPRPGSLLAYTGLVLVQWTVLLVFVSARLWRAGRGEATVVRRRVRLLSVAAAGMAIAVIISGFVPAGWGRTTTQTMGVVAAGLFLLGFAPPRPLRMMWRTPETNLMREATTELMRATTAQEVTGILLPHVSALVGGRAAALVDQAGEVVASHGKDPATMETDVAEAFGRGHGRRGSAPVEVLPGLIRTRLEGGVLLVWASPWAPFFGGEELGLVRALGGLADLALERAALFAQERQFIANASHEMRTPLTAIAGLADTLARRWEDLPPDTTGEVLEAIGRQGERARVLIQNLLDLSKIGSDNRVTTRGVELREAVAAALEAAPPPPAARLTVEPGPDVNVRAEPVRLEQVLTNLLTNAYRYGGPEVTIRIRAQDGSATLEVRDDGPGVHPDLVPSLFDPFTRGPAQAATPGSGLGLAISKRLAESFGGRLAYNRGEPRGAAFSLTMEVVR